MRTFSRPGSGICVQPQQQRGLAVSVLCTAVAVSAPAGVPRELRKLPVLVWAFDVAGFVPLERANKDQSSPAIDRAADALRQGHSFFIFPEGTRSRTGELLPFKKGQLVMALKAQAPLVPIVVAGGRQAMRKGSPLIWPTTVTVTVLPAVPTSGSTTATRSLRRFVS